MNTVIHGNFGDPVELPRGVIPIRPRPMTFGEWPDRRARHESAGVEEWRLVNPVWPQFVEGWQRVGTRLLPIPEEQMDGWLGPRLGARFHPTRAGRRFHGRMAR